MEKVLYFEPIFSDRRERLIDLCVSLQKQGKNFIYILPSREAIRDVRYKLLELLGGFLNSKIIMFDELERDITDEFINSSSVIFEDVEKLLLRMICENSEHKLKYFDKICTKTGFIEESKSFINNLKRSLVDPEKLRDSLETVEDLILKDKLLDLQLVYNEYVKSLRENKIYDVNDISQIAIDKVLGSSALSEIDTLIIDGFINIDKVNIELIRKIVSMDKLNIYVNCPYINSFSEEFLEKEILKPFEGMKFRALSESEGFYETKPYFKELAEQFYSGNKIMESPDRITISKYPCIASEVRETARSIKEKLIKGEKAENVAIFVNSKDAYSKAMNTIFREFSIPLSMAYEVPLRSSQLARDLLSFIKNAEETSVLGEVWFKSMEEKLQQREQGLSSLAPKAFKMNLDYEDKLHLKSKDALEKLINDMKQGFEIGEMLNKEINREDFLNIYIDYLNNATLTMEKSDNSGVKVLNTDLAKGVYYKHVYVLGINEGEMPKVIKNNGLFDELEVQKLKSLGIKYEDYLWELSREKMWFNLTLASAKESLALSYRSASEDGKFAISSSLLEEVKHESGLEDTIAVSMRERFYIPVSKVMSSKELKAMELRDFFEKKYRGFDGLNIDEKVELVESFKEMFKESVLSGLAEFHRGREKDFNRFEGVIKDNIDGIILSKNSFSPSRLNDYFVCPFKYMLKHLFHIEEEQEEQNELSAMEKGDFYHKVLFYYYDGLKNFKDLEESKFETSFTRAFEEIRQLEISEEELELLKNELNMCIKNFIECDLKRVNKYEKETGKIIRPFLLEQFIESRVFGELITARVDRVDLEYEIIGGKQIPTGRYIVYDYKKKSISGIDDIIGKENCQIAFYYYFVEEYLKEKLPIEDLDCMALLYLSVEDTNKSIKKNGLYRTEYKQALGFTGNSRFDMNKELFYILLDYLKSLIEESIEHIKEGSFPYKLDCKCFDDFSHTYCEFDSVCRYSKEKMTAIAEV